VTPAKPVWGRDTRFPNAPPASRHSRLTHDVAILQIAEEAHLVTERVERRLAAILAADVAGYSRLMAANEEETLAAFKGLCSGIVDPEIAEHHGRIVKTTGDGLLAEFASAVEAVRCAMAIQRRMAEHNDEVPAGRRIEFRIGINVGDIIFKENDIHGDGVNVAARLEGLALPGGICISRTVSDQVATKLSVRLDDLGEQSVKNIPYPVHAYRVQVPRQPLAGRPMPAPPGMPSIAVLPFDNMSSEPEQAHFADGISEDIITSLSKISSLFVIARNSCFAYRGKSPDVRAVARELGVRHVLEGSVRRAGNRIRVTAQLIDGETGAHEWAERYDRSLADIFDLQDEITSEIVNALEVQLTEGEQARIRKRQTVNVAAWECCARGHAHFRALNRDDNARARALLEQAVKLDPNFATAWTLLARTYAAAAKVGWSDVNESLAKASRIIEKCLALDDTQSDTYTALAAIRVLEGRNTEAVAAAERAVALGPSVADAHGFLGLVLNYVGRPQEAIAQIEHAMRLSPVYPDWCLGMLGVSYRLLKRYDDAIAADKERLRRNPLNAFSDIRLAVVYAELGRMDEARAHVAAALRKNPQYSLRQARLLDPFEDPAEMERYLSALRRAGLPE
jgi:adenylate cyclase